MRYLVLFVAAVVVASCAPHHKPFEKPSMNRPCREECLFGELACVDSIHEEGGYFVLGPVIIGGATTATALRSCQLAGEICTQQCIGP